MDLYVRWRLSFMMFLQYAIWGAWAPVLAAYLMDDKAGLGFSAFHSSVIYSLLPLATIISPFLGGQIADRWLPTQWFLAIAQLVGGVVLLVMAQAHSFVSMAGLMLLFALVYAPTLALTNSICFHHLQDREREFGGIRVQGSIGWIVAGWMLTLWRTKMISVWGISMSGVADSLVLAGVGALVMSIFCLFLPHTPPAREGTNPWAFLEAVKLLKNRSFLVFMLISFVVVTELQFYYILTAPFLEKGLGINSARVPATMTIAQLAEIVAMALALPYVLPRLGVGKSLAIGVLAWPIRYAIFAIGGPAWLVLAALSLHGICYVFFFVVGQIYVDSVATPDIRASAQALLAVITLGFGNFLGALFAGKIGDLFTNRATGAMNWRGVFLVPCALTVLCAIAFLLFFRPPGKPQGPAAAGGEQEPPVPPPPLAPPPEGGDQTGA